MATTGLCLQFIRDLERPHLLKQMTGDDLDALMNCLERLPEFSEQYLSHLVRIHETRFPGMATSPIERRHLIVSPLTRVWCNRSKPGCDCCIRSSGNTTQPRLPPGLLRWESGWKAN